MHLLTLNLGAQALKTDSTKIGTKKTSNPITALQNAGPTILVELAIITNDNSVQAPPKAVPKTPNATASSWAPSVRPGWKNATAMGERKRRGPITFRMGVTQMEM